MSEKLKAEAVAELRGQIADKYNFFISHSEATEILSAVLARNTRPSTSPDTALVAIRDIALAAIRRARKEGESAEMLARWISEDIHRAAAAIPPAVGEMREALSRIWTIACLDADAPLDIHAQALTDIEGICAEILDGPQSASKGEE